MVVGRIMSRVTVSTAVSAYSSGGRVDDRSDAIWERDDEAVPIRHLHLRQRLGIHHIVLADDPVEEQDIGGGRVDVVRAEQLAWRVERHGASREIEYRRGMPPEVADRLRRVDAAGQRWSAEQRSARHRPALA